MMPSALPAWHRHPVLVVGDAMLDHYWSGSVARISPEAPVPVFETQQRLTRLGGAANVAANIISLGGQAHLLTPIGVDEAGRSLNDLLRAQNIVSHAVPLKDYRTTQKTRILSKNQQMIRLDDEVRPPSSWPHQLKTLLSTLMPQVRALALSDYGKGALSEVPGIIKMARDFGCPVVVDPKGHDYQIYSGATLLTPNRSEFEKAARPCHSEEDFLEQGRLARERWGVEYLLVTRGAEGMTLFSADAPPYTLAAQRHEVFDVTGAGDVVLALLSLAFSADLPILEGIGMANEAAGLSVQRLGTCSIAYHELLHSYAFRSKALALPSLLAQREELRGRGEKLVFTNGCFDILHVGHARYLQEARQLGHRLVVAVNDDASVSRLKGPSRPVQPLEARMEMLAALASVDWVVSFSEDTPEALIRSLSPDILVKGGDYTLENIVGSDFVLARGGKVYALPFHQGFSTTSILSSHHQKILECES